MSAKTGDVKTLAQLTDAELDAEDTRLAAERTRVRLAQNDVTAEKETRALLAGLSGASREVVRARLEGTIGSSGGAVAEGGTE